MRFIGEKNSIVMTELTNMPNIGKEMASKLESVGIDTKERLIDIGAEEVFFKLKTKYPNVCLVHLYALEGAIQNVDFNCLSEKTKARLKAFSDTLK